MESARSLVNKVTSMISNIKSLGFRSTICLGKVGKCTTSCESFSGKWPHCANAIVLQLVYILKGGFTPKMNILSLFTLLYAVIFFFFSVDIQ